jgi:hypothetical protein
MLLWEVLRPLITLRTWSPNPGLDYSFISVKRTRSVFQDNDVDCCIYKLFRNCCQLLGPSNLRSPLRGSIAALGPVGRLPSTVGLCSFCPPSASFIHDWKPNCAHVEAHWNALHETTAAACRFRTRSSSCP